MTKMMRKTTGEVGVGANDAMKRKTKRTKTLTNGHVANAATTTIS